MSQPSRLDELVQKYLDAACSKTELSELQNLLATDPSAADVFARASRLSANLSKFVRGETGIRTTAAKVLDIERRRKSRWVFFRRVGIAAAAVLIVAVPVILVFLTYLNPRLVAGEVLVDGVSAKRLRYNATIIAQGEVPAVINLADGSAAELIPHSEVVLRGGIEGTRQTIALNRGRGEFTVEKGGGTFVVNTPLGKITALGTRFSVELRPGPSEKEQHMNGKSALILAVAVMAGSVRVEWRGETLVLKAGESRVFAEEPSTSQPARTAETAPPAASQPKPETSSTPPAATESAPKPAPQRTQPPPQAAPQTPAAGGPAFRTPSAPEEIKGTEPRTPARTGRFSQPSTPSAPEEQEAPASRQPAQSAPATPPPASSGR